MISDIELLKEFLIPKKSETKNIFFSKGGPFGIFYPLISVSYMFSKVFSNRNVEFMTGVFKTYIRPLVEYATPVWSPHKLIDVDLVESVQRSYTSHLSGLHVMEYLNRLKVCNLESLELRRLINDMVFVYKILNNRVDLNPDEFFSLRATTVCTRGHSLRIYPNQFKRILQNFFLRE